MWNSTGYGQIAAIFPNLLKIKYRLEHKSFHHDWKVQRKAWVLGFIPARVYSCGRFRLGGEVGSRLRFLTELSLGLEQTQFQHTVDFKTKTKSLNYNHGFDVKLLLAAYHHRFTQYKNDTHFENYL